MGRRPAFQFYPADWRKDAELQSCSMTARGLWHEAMCIMHECEPYGELRVNGKPMSTGQLARLVGMTLTECKRALDELESAGVPSRTEDGALYSRRMVRDEQIRNARASGGELGAEHGIKGKKDGLKGGRPRKETGVEKPPLEPPPSSSTSSSSSASTEETRSLRERSARKAKTHIPDNFPDDDARRRAQEVWSKKGRPDLAASVLDEITAFRDHHLSTGKTSADWPASWRTWVKNAPKFTPQERANGHARRESPHVQADRVARELLDEFNARDAARNPDAHARPGLVVLRQGDDRGPAESSAQADVRRLGGPFRG